MSEGVMNKVRLGRTDLMVTSIGFGTSGLGDMPDTYGYGVDADRAKATVLAIFGGPANLIDTSRLYGMGRSEERIGAVIRERGGLPPGFVLSTKLDRDLEDNRFDAAQARRSFEQSLKALGLERVDLLHLHDPEYASSFKQATARDGALGELFRIKEEGLAKAVGLAAGVVAQMMPLLNDWDFDALITHNRFTLANRNADAMLNLARARGIAVLNAAPYASGVLAKGTTAYPRYVYQEASDAVLYPIRRIEAVCARFGVPPGAAALQFSIRNPRITSTICGVTRPERVEQTLDWANFPIPEAAWAELMALPYASDDPEGTRDYKPG
jgi:D-threo-aldose 1-dehydrogenase